MTARLSTNKNIYFPGTTAPPSLQYVGGGSGSVGGGFSQGASSAWEVWMFLDQPTYLAGFIAGVLGYARKNGTTIRRSLPARHPLLPWCWASSVGWEGGFGPTGKREALDGVTASFKYLQCRVNYEAPPYAILADGVPEYLRFVVLTSEPNSEFLTRRYGSYRWPAGTPNLTSYVLAEGIPQLLIKERLVFTWIQVPDDGFFTNGGQAYPGAVPQKAIDGLGKVNSAEFYGYPAGTLLLEGFRLTPVAMPILPSIIGKDNFDGYPQRAWNVDYYVTLFNPPPADTNKRGHNLFPHPTQPEWYRIHKKGGADTEGFWRYQTYDYTKLFEMNT